MSIGVAKILSSNVAAEKLCACAARISTTSKNSLELYDADTGSEKDQSLIKKVLQSGHSSVVEHVVINIAFQNASVFVEQFLIEFRLASFTVKSRRYVDFRNASYYVPESLTDEQKEKYTQHMDFLFGQYEKLVEHNIPKEDARFILPYSLGSNFYMTVNARELRHILDAMLFGRGKRHAEIRELGLSILDQAFSLFPSIFSDFYKKRKDNYSTTTFVESAEKKKTKNVDNKMTVELINYPQFPEKILALAASINSVEYDLPTLLQKEHSREIEQLNYTFSIDKLTFASITHLTRHRMQSLLVPSLTCANENNVIIPESVSSNTEAMALYGNAIYANVMFINEMEKEGVSRDVLVYSLLCGTTLDILTTMNLRELNLFLKLRVCNRAQWEIREAARQLLFKLREQSIEIFSHLGPSCFVGGKCPEGRLSCGKIDEVIKEYSVKTS